MTVLGVYHQLLRTLTETIRLDIPSWRSQLGSPDGGLGFTHIMFISYYFMKMQIPMKTLSTECNQTRCWSV